MFDFDDVGRRNELVSVINNYAIIGVFADRLDVEEVLATVDKWTFEGKSDDLEVVWIDNSSIDMTDGSAGLDAKNSGADKT